MTGKMQIAWVLHIVLGLMLLIGLFPLPSMSMQTGHMAITSGASAFYENASAEHSAPTSCCNDTIGSLAMTCGVLIPHYDGAPHFARTQRVAFSPLFIPVMYRQSETPPPKI